MAFSNTWTLSTLLAAVFLLLISTITYLLSAGRVDTLLSLPERSNRRVDAKATLPAIDDINSVPEDVRLERVLRKAAMVDKTVILTSVNYAWARPGSILDVFLESFRTGERTLRLLDHLVIVAMDRKAYFRCQAMHHHCFALTTDGVDFSGQKEFMSDGYLKLVWRKIDFLATVLKKGYNFLFADADIVWFRDPLPQFSMDIDFQISCDRYYGNSNGAPNSGFHYVRSNNRTIEFYSFWYRSRLRHPRRHDQDVLNAIRRDPFVRKIGMTTRFLDTAYFGGLCQPSKDFNKVCTMHANCCVGLHKKVHDLRVLLGDWRRFMSRPPSINGSHLGTWSAPQICSLRHSL